MAAAILAMVERLGLCHHNHQPHQVWTVPTGRPRIAPQGKACTLSRWTPDAFTDAESREKQALSAASLPGK